MRAFMYSVFRIMITSLILGGALIWYLIVVSYPSALESRPRHAPIFLLGQPTPSQHDIDLAIRAFNIGLSPNALHPTYDPHLEDRGLTTLRGPNAKLVVTIGPAAFSSWGMLGSTLAHELEVHCRQNFVLISLKDELGLEGTKEAEIEAYAYELIEASRFRLSDEEQTGIIETMKTYYGY